MRFDEDMTLDEWARQEAAIDVEQNRRDFDRDRFREDEPLPEDEARQNVIDAGGF
jgi:hypothetical protein